MKNNDNLKIIIKTIVCKNLSEFLSEQELDNFSDSILKILYNHSIKCNYLCLDIEDFLFCVYEAIIEVSKKYDPNQKKCFLAYSNFIVKRRLLDYSRKLRTYRINNPTISAINSYRTEVYNFGEQQDLFDSYLEKEAINNFDKFKNDNEIKISLLDFKNKLKTIREKEILDLMYQGYSQTEISKKLKATRYEVEITKEKLKNYISCLFK